MKKKIMVVDDEEDNRTTVKDLLESRGYNVITAINGDDCLKKLEKNKVDLILLDIMMPGMPVREVVKKISGTKIVYLSVVRTSEAERENLMSKEVIDFVQKPFDINLLLEKVKKYTN